MELNMTRMILRSGTVLSANNQSNNKWDIVFWDTETTGFSPENDRIIEIAFLRESDDFRYQSLVSTDVEIHWAAKRVHKITKRMISGKPRFKKVAQKLTKIFKKPTLFIAHNSDGFDKKFIKAEFERSDVNIPEHWVFLDSLKIARSYLPDLATHKLQELRIHFGIAENTAHRAMDDVVILQKVFKRIVNDELDPYDIAQRANCLDQLVTTERTPEN
jgi:DNA polymerase III subunit epsilon